MLFPRRATAIETKMQTEEDQTPAIIFIKRINFQVAQALPEYRAPHKGGCSLLFGLLWNRRLRLQLSRRYSIVHHLLQ